MDHFNYFFHVLSRFLLKSSDTVEIFDFLMFCFGGDTGPGPSGLCGARAPTDLHVDKTCGKRKSEAVARNLSSGKFEFEIGAGMSLAFIKN